VSQSPFTAETQRTQRGRRDSLSGEGMAPDMRSRLWFSASSLRSRRLCGELAVAVALLAPATSAGEAPGQPGKFVVHEWGVQVRTVGRLSYETPVPQKGDGHIVMQNVPAPDGNARSLFAAPGELIAGLPNFVLRHAAEYKPKYHVTAWDKPVLHFYGPEGREVSVQLLTPQGRPLAYWPKPTLVEKPRKDGWLAGADLAGLSWKGQLSGQPTGKVQEVKDGHWWRTVREVPGLWFNTDSGSERFVFYEASALQEPLLIGKVGAEELTLENTHTADSGPVVVIVNDGQARHFLAVPNVATGAKVKFTKKDLLAADGDAEKLLAACRTQWESFGMTKEEARAIVETWKPDLLNKVGFLVAARAPAETYERMFPLTITPKPDQLVRAGLFFDTLPGEEARAQWLPAVERTFEKWAGELGHNEFAVREAARRRFADMGDLARGFIEKLTRATDPEVRSSAERLIEELKSGTVVVPDSVGKARAGGSK
jgi:hypothetical protein